MDVIDHPVFQRMRDIRQNGLLRYVIPSANHTRFEHSIGSTYMSQMMLNALMHGSESGASKLYPLEGAKDGQAVRFHELTEKTRRRIKRLTRLSTLAHDLGHGPLSHIFDTFAPRVEELEGPLLDDVRLDAIRPLGTRITRGNHGHVRHEAVSCILFAKIWHDLGGELWISQAVAVVLLGDHAGTDAIPADIRPWLPFVRDIVSSAPIDADRMDYLLRDSIAIGAKYGLYEPDRILKGILCVRMSNGYRLGWRISSLRAIEHFMDARFHMFAQIYSHKTNRCIELMLQKIERSYAAGNNGRLIRCTTLDEFVEGYLNLSDESLLRVLTHLPNSPDVAKLAQDLVRRKLWKRLYTFERDELGFAEAHKVEMEKRHPGRTFLLDTQPLRATKDLEHGAFLMRSADDGRYVVSDESRSWLDVSPKMKTLRDEEQALTRLFVTMDDSNRGSNRALRNEAIALAHQLRKR
jgi:hypothetical protein